jgi:integrase
MANPTYPQDPHGGPAIDGEEYMHACGCVSRLIAGRWYVIKACEAGLRQGVQLLHTVRQKGGTEKTMTVPAGVQPIIQEYVQARQDRAVLLFVTHPGERPMHAGAVRDVWHGVAAELGIAPFTTHALRHTFATQLLARGVDIRIVAELMGHKNMQSIMGYTEVMESSRQLAERALEDVIQAPAVRDVPADPRATDPHFLRKTKRRGRPRFRIMPP